MKQKDAINDNVLKYQHCLESIRHRLQMIQEMLSMKADPGFPELISELIMLQFRKALEELAFSSLCSNVDRYSEAHKNFATYWRAKALLDEIGKMNPNFYPKPLRCQAGVSVEPPAYLTLDDFKVLYDLSSAAIHSGNPYRKESPPESAYSYEQWLERFRNLLRTHYIQLLDYEETWTVIMPDTGPISVGVAKLKEIPQN